MYNYLDYQFVNNTTQTFQLIIHTTEDYLCGELKSDKELEHSYHIIEENHYFNKEANEYYRNNEVYRQVIDKRSGNVIDKHIVVKNHAKVLYDYTYIPADRIDQEMCQ